MDAEDRLFGEIAVKLGLIDRPSLSQHVAMAESRPGELAAVLVETGVLNREQAAKVRVHQQRILDKRYGPTQRGTKATAQSKRHSVRPEARTAVAQDLVIPKNSSQREQPATTRERKRAYLDKVLEVAAKRGASDLHIHSGAPFLARIHGTLTALRGEHVLSEQEAKKVIAQVLTDEQWQQLAEEGQLDFAYEVPDIGRFRANAYRQERGYDLVFRLIPTTAPSLRDLGLPETLAKLTDFRTGLVLCTGPAGCGKSTTLTAILNVLLNTRKEHVITLENPIEFVFESTQSWINQRQIGAHTQSFARALRAALREDPDIIAITELRDKESMSLALSAAETGHLVLGTLHTGSAGQTISRIISAFSADEQGHVRSMLSESLRAVVSQRLVPRADGKGRAVAIEVLICNTAVSNMIRDNKIFQLPSIMQTGKSLGMLTLDNSLFELVQAGTITKQEAARVATAKERFK